MPASEPLNDDQQTPDTDLQAACTARYLELYRGPVGRNFLLTLGTGLVTTAAIGSEDPHQYSTAIDAAGMALFGGALLFILLVIAWVRFTVGRQIRSKNDLSADS